MPGNYIDFYDYIDGGGAGRMGDTFQGGGILSMLANEFFTPYGSKDEERRKRLMQMRGLFDALEAKTSGGASGFTPVGGEKIETAPVQTAGEMSRMQRVNEVPTSGPNPAVAAEVSRLQQARRMQEINEVPTVPLADMPATKFMDVLRSAPSEEPVPFGGFQQPGSEYRRAYDQIVERFGVRAVNEMPMDQLTKLMQLYAHGGPLR